MFFKFISKGYLIIWPISSESLLNSINWEDPPDITPHMLYILFRSRNKGSWMLMFEGQSRASFNMLVRFFVIKFWFLLKFSLNTFSTKTLFSINVALLIFIYKTHWCKKYSLKKVIAFAIKVSLSWWLRIEIDKIFLSMSGRT